MAQSSANHRPPLASSAQNHLSSNLDDDFKIVVGSTKKEVPAHPIQPANTAQTSSENNDTFKVRSHSSVLPPMDDQDSWPEVGSLALSTISQSSKESKDGSEMNDKNERNKPKKGWNVI
jgi:hypothetical protein